MLVITCPAAASEQLFLENCAVCHQRDGTGIPKVYPSLATSEVVRGSAVDMALVMLVGRGEMPSFKGALSSADMASIINYVRGTIAQASGTIDAAKIDSLD
jgi:mono/diheme cytochrome c family protein